MFLIRWGFLVNANVCVYKTFVTLARSRMSKELVRVFSKSEFDVCTRYECGSVCVCMEQHHQSRSVEHLYVCTGEKVKENAGEGITMGLFLWPGVLYAISRSFLLADSYICMCGRIPETLKVTWPTSACFSFALIVFILILFFYNSRQKLKLF